LKRKQLEKDEENNASGSGLILILMSVKEVGEMRVSLMFIAKVEIMDLMVAIERWTSLIRMCRSATVCKCISHSDQVLHKFE